MVMACFASHIIMKGVMMVVDCFALLAMTKGSEWWFVDCFASLAMTAPNIVIAKAEGLWQSSLF